MVWFPYVEQLQPHVHKDRALHDLHKLVDLHEEADADLELSEFFDEGKGLCEETEGEGGNGIVTPAGEEVRERVLLLEERILLGVFLQEGTELSARY